MLLDHQTLFRESLREMLGNERELSVVADCDNLEDAARAASHLHPSIVLFDADTPSELLEGLQRIRAASPESRILALTFHDDPWMIRTLIGQGIHGYLSKSVSRLELVYAIRVASARSPRMVFISSYEKFNAALGADRTGAANISRRERDILMLVSEGLSNSQISKRLAIAEGTVKRHLGNVFIKLGASSRIDAVNRAVTADLL
ncbi:LuxR C-terminal-related transcriptional regulator [Actinomadura harenae]|nr:response regulator transcription factor [Actinomadura harenae]